jgi:hypothetical protein
MSEALLGTLLIGLMFLLFALGVEISIALVMVAALARQVKILLGPPSLRDEVAPKDDA